jgi:hypothetical protein
LNRPSVLALPTCFAGFEDMQIIFEPGMRLEFFDFGFFYNLAT